MERLRKEFEGVKEALHDYYGSRGKEKMLGMVGGDGRGREMFGESTLLERRRMTEGGNDSSEFSTRQEDLYDLSADLSADSLG